MAQNPRSALRTGVFQNRVLQNSRFELPVFVCVLGTVFCFLGTRFGKHLACDSCVLFPRFGVFWQANPFTLDILFFSLAFCIRVLARFGEDVTVISCVLALRFEISLQCCTAYVWLHHGSIEDF